MNVIDAASNAGVPDAEVGVSGIVKRTRTNWIGEAALTGIPFGEHRASVRKVGYVGADVPIQFGRDTVSYIFILARARQTLDTMTTVARSKGPQYMQEFAQRQRLGIGRFITDSVLEANSTIPIAEIISARVPGLAIVGAGRLVASRLCGRLDIYVDGLRTTPGVSIAPFQHSADDAVDFRVLSGRDVAGVEFYKADEAPVQFRHLGMTCGVLLVWLRR